MAYAIIDRRSGGASAWNKVIASAIGGLGLSSSLLLMASAGPAQALVIQPVFDSTVTGRSNAAAIESAFKTAANTIGAQFSAPITVKIGVSWGSVHGQSLGTNIGSSWDPFYTAMSYSSLVNTLKSRSKAYPSDSLFAEAAANLPAADPTHLNRFEITEAQAQALGLAPSSLSANSGYVGFSATAAFDFNPADGITTGTYDFQGLAGHEIAEALGRITGLYTTSPTWASPIDLFRYTAPGASSFSYGAGAYFSIDGGKTKLASYNNAGGGDRSDWLVVSGSTDAENAAIYSGRVLTLSVADWTMLDVMGWGAPASLAVTPLSPSPGSIGIQGAASAAPEPATWCLAFIGLSLVGGVSRRRRVASLR